MMARIWCALALYILLLMVRNNHTRANNIFITYATMPGATPTTAPHTSKYTNKPKYANLKIDSFYKVVRCILT